MGATLPPTSQVENLRKLGLTDTEIADVLATDKEIDQGIKHFELAEDLKPGAKKARRADRTDTPKKANRERKPNEDKQTLLHLLQCGLGDDVADLVVTNQEREFLFTYNGIKYKVVLSCPRTQEQVRLLLHACEGAEFGKMTNFGTFYFDFFV